MFSNKSAIPPVIIQHATSGEILMVGQMNIYAYHKTLRFNKLFLYDPISKSVEQVGVHCNHYLTVQEYYVNKKANILVIKVLPSFTQFHKCLQSHFSRVEITK